MDSLGFQHTQTVDILGKYLQLVAKDKKKATISKLPAGRALKVRGFYSSYGCD